MCCNLLKCISQKTVYYTFILINSLVWLAAVSLIIYNIAETLSGIVGLSSIYSIPTIPGISSYATQTILVISTFLVTLFSGIAAMGMESASYREYWNKEPFVSCFCFCILKWKMGVYIFVVGFIGILIFLIALFLQTGIIDLNLTDILTNVTLGTCNNLFENEILSFQENNDCCGIEFSLPKSNSDVPTCANWYGNVPKGCGCDTTYNNSKCMTISYAENTYGCKIGDNSGFDGIWSQGCLNIMNETYFDEFNVFWIICYVLGASFIAMSALGVCICYQTPETKKYRVHEDEEGNGDDSEEK